MQLTLNESKHIGVQGESTQELLLVSSAFNEAIRYLVFARRVKNTQNLRKNALPEKFGYQHYEKDACKI